MSDNNINHQRPADIIAGKAMKSISKNYLVLGKGEVTSWKARLVIGLVGGISLGVMLISNRSAQLERAKAMEFTAQGGEATQLLNELEEYMREAEEYLLPEANQEPINKAPSSVLGAKTEQTSCRSYPIDEVMKLPDNERAKITATHAEKATKALSENAVPDAIQKIAKARKAILLETMRRDPETALSYTLPPDSMKDVSKNCREEVVEKEGELEILHADFFDDEQAVYQYTLVTPEDERIRLHPAHIETVDFPLVSSVKIKVKGYAIDNDLLVDTRNEQDLEVLPAAEKSSSLFIPEALAYHKQHVEVWNDISRQAAQEARGDQRIAVLMVNFNDTPVPQITRESISDLVFHQMKDYYIENSYGKITNISGDIFPPMTTSTSPAWYTMDLAKTCDMFQVFLNGVVRILADNVDLRAYDRLILYIPAMRKCFSGSAIIGKGATVLSKRISISYIANTGNSSLRTLAHEFGHNLGLYHASRMRCPQGAAINIQWYNCKLIEYGDGSSVMGGGAMSHFNLPQKDFLGWLRPGMIREINEDSDISIGALALNNNDLKGVKIERGVQRFNDRVYVEYYDMVRSEFFGGLLHTLSYDSQTYLLYPENNQGALSMRPGGNSFTDYSRGFTITMNGQDDSTLRLHVDFDTIDLSVTSFLKIPIDPITYDPLSSLKVLPAIAGDTAVFNVIVANRGTGDVLVGVDLNFRIDLHNDGSWDETRPDQVYFLWGNSTQSLGFTPVLFPLENDTHKIEICIDPEAIVADTDRTNNCLTEVFELFTKGDINRDGFVTSENADLILACKAQLSVCDDEQIRLGDMNNDGILGVVDANMIKASLPASIGVAPASVNFGEILEGTELDNIVTVTNTGGMNLDGSVSGLDQPFSCVSGCTYTIPGNTSVNVTIRFSPTSAGEFSDTAEFTGGEGASVSVVGKGKEPPPPPPPTISTINPSQGYYIGGTELQIIGSNFLTPTITIGGKSATVTSATDSEIKTLTPVGSAGKADVIVVNSNGQRATRSGGFTYVKSGTLDQQSTAFTSDVNNIVDYQQSFTAGVTGELTNLEIGVGGYRQDAIVTISIYEESSIAPTTSTGGRYRRNKRTARSENDSNKLLYAENDIKIRGDASNNFTLNSIVKIQKDKMYSYRIKRTGGASTLTVRHEHAPKKDPYLGGKIKVIDSNGSDSTLNKYDGVFKTYVVSQ